jgi:hypothetical protein
MTFEEIRQALFELNRLHATLLSAEKFRQGILKGETSSPRMSARTIQGINPEHLTWEDLRREVTSLETRIEKETGFGVAYFHYPGMEGEAGSYVLIPKTTGYLEAKHASRPPEVDLC